MAFKFDFLNSRENKTQHEKDTKEYREQHQNKESKPLTAEEIRGIVNREMNNASAKNQVIGYFDSIAESSVRTEAMLAELKEELEVSLAGIKDAALNSAGTERLERIDESVKRVVELTGSLEQIDESVKRVAAMTGSIEQIDESVKRVAAMTGSIEQIDESVRRVEAMTGSLEQMDRSVRQVAEAAGRFDEIDQSIKRVEAMSESLEQIDESTKNVIKASESLEAVIHKDNLIMYKNIKDALEEIKESGQNSSKALRSGLIVSLIFNAITIVILAVFWIVYFL